MFATFLARQLVGWSWKCLGDGHEMMVTDYDTEIPEKSWYSHTIIRDLIMTPLMSTSCLHILHFKASAHPSIFICF